MMAMAQIVEGSGGHIDDKSAEFDDKSAEVVATCKRSLRSVYKSARQAIETDKKPKQSPFEVVVLAQTQPKVAKAKVQSIIEAVLEVEVVLEVPKVIVTM